MIREALVINDLPFTLSCEHSLHLLEDGSILHLSFLEQAKLPGGLLTPVEGPLRETFVANSVLSHRNVVVSFNSC